MKEVLLRPNLQNIKDAYEKESSIFLCPDLNPLEKERYIKLFHAYAPSSSVCFLTSGSTGRPKIIVHSWKNLKVHAAKQALELGLTKKSHYLNPLPFFHLSGFMPILRSLASGSKLSIKEDSKSLIESLLTLGPSHVSLVPSQLVELTKNHINLGFLDTLLLGGSGCSASVLKDAQLKGYPIRACYGMTETASFFSISDSEEFINSGSIKLRLLDGWNAFTQEDNRLVIESEFLFTGHIDEKGLSLANNLLPTNDLGDVDYPFINIIGRSDLVYLSGAEKVDPLEVEKKILDLIELEEVVIVPKEDNKWGQITCAFITPFDSRIDYHAFCKALPSHQRPKHFLPLGFNNGIKPNRSQLKEKLKHIKNSKKIAFIHGFMGTTEDLKALSEGITTPSVHWSLPHHERNSTANSFKDVVDFYIEKVKEEKVSYLYGYSMGARVCMAIAHSLYLQGIPLEGLILESGNTGIKSEQAREERFLKDKELFKRMPKDPTAFYESWYSMPLFGDFKNTKEGKRRIANSIKSWSPENWAKCIELLSVGKQKDFKEFLKSSPHSILYLYGENDSSYKRIGLELQSTSSSSVKVKSVKNAFHNIHSCYPQIIIHEVNSFTSGCF